ncbi:hypothetical protein M5K25_011570 [Dendrobium thyrsiflorum]|uniref:Uncharacterized protein n=1 Tax=Dendrobium thyrsiflorum TaxID=117978 RepID=A0ABD0V3W2_DENTH
MDLGLDRVFAVISLSQPSSPHTRPALPLSLSHPPPLSLFLSLTRPPLPLFPSLLRPTKQAPSKPPPPPTPSPPSSPRQACMGDPDVDHGFVFDDQGRTDILASPFFDMHFGTDETVDDNVDRILYQLNNTFRRAVGTSSTIHQVPGYLSGDYYLTDRLSSSSVTKLVCNFLPLTATNKSVSEGLQAKINASYLDRSASVVSSISLDDSDGSLDISSRSGSVLNLTDKLKLESKLPKLKPFLSDSETYSKVAEEGTNWNFEIPQISSSTLAITNMSPLALTCDPLVSIGPSIVHALRLSCSTFIINLHHHEHLHQTHKTLKKSTFPHVLSFDRSIGHVRHGTEESNHAKGSEKTSDDRATVEQEKFEQRKQDLGSLETCGLTLTKNKRKSFSQPKGLLINVLKTGPAGSTVNWSGDQSDPAYKTGSTSNRIEPAKTGGSTGEPDRFGKNQPIL